MLKICFDRLLKERVFDCFFCKLYFVKFLVFVFVFFSVGDDGFFLDVVVKIFRLLGLM